MEPHRLLILASEGEVPAEALVLVERRLRRGPVAVTLLVPVCPLPDAWVWDVERTSSAAVDGLALGLAQLDQTGAIVAGTFGDRDPMVALNDLMDRIELDEVVLCLPDTGRSRLLRMDLPARIRRAFGVPVTHVPTGPREPAPIAA